MRKSLIFTVDTEGDNLWQWKPGKAITTENAACLDRFQLFCEQHGIAPVYLINYEMAQSDVLVSLLKYKAHTGLCEIGMHMHAWNTPPEYALQNHFGGCPYITEYPDDIVYKKHLALKQAIEERFEVTPVSYRSGRWATNETLFRVLEQIGIRADCSVTPGITHRRNKGMSVPGGNEYSASSGKPYWVSDHVLEIPMTSMKIRSLHGTTIKNRVSHFIKGEQLWMRPAIQSFQEIQRLITAVERTETDYLEMMIHSSELLPGANPYCKTAEDVEKMYEKMKCMFRLLIPQYQSVTMKHYRECFRSINESTRLE